MSGTAFLPERIGRFRIRSMLGRGAMGVVYLGHDEEIDRLVAIKLIRADLLATDERDSYLRRFRNEAKIAGRCLHANIVGLYDFAMHDDNPYLVMEYVNGVGLQQFFPRGTKCPPAEVTHIALQVLDALHYAHGRSIVHRDIKPANILMMPDTSLKITDFGISRLTSMELTATPLLIGTPSYMSPEQCLGSVLDGRNDLFSLGCVLYELAAGERAFSGVNYTETIFSIVNKPHVPLGERRPDLPPGFGAAIDRALSKSPDDRYPSAAAFARTLDDIARAANLPRTGFPAAIVNTHATGAPAGAGAMDAQGDTADGEAAPATVATPLADAWHDLPAGHAAPSGMDPTATGDPPTVEPPAGLAPAEVPPVAASRGRGFEAEPVAPGAPTPAASLPGLRPPVNPPAERPVPEPAAADTPEPAPEPEPVAVHPSDAPRVDPDATMIQPRRVPAPDHVAGLAEAPATGTPAPGTPAPETPAPETRVIEAPVFEAPVVERTSFETPFIGAGAAEAGPTRTGPADAEPTLSDPLAVPPFPAPPGAAHLPPPPHPSAANRLEGTGIAADAPVWPFAPDHSAAPEPERERIAACLAAVIGPIAPLLVRRTATPGITATALAGRLADYVHHPVERSRFLDLVQGGARPRGTAGR